MALPLDDFDILLWERADAMPSPDEYRPDKPGRKVPEHVADVVDPDDFAVNAAASDDEPF